jgi:uncharacterized OB-fold protein
MSSYEKPLPVPDETTGEFWAQARKHRLVFQRCQHCGTYAHPPVDFCSACHNLTDPSFRFEEVGTRGRIVNWTVMHDKMVRGFEDDDPWVNVLVELDEQERLLFMATLEDGRVPGLVVGAPVEVAFRDVTDTVSLPCFRLMDDGR